MLDEELSKPVATKPGSKMAGGGAPHVSKAPAKPAAKAAKDKSGGAFDEPAGDAPVAKPAKGKPAKGKQPDAGGDAEKNPFG
jgi:hypothetical protein